jgi:protein O-GlcNAc transferase
MVILHRLDRPAKTTTAMNEHQDLINSAFQLHRSGHIREALDLYNEVLPWQRNNAQLLYLLGTANLQIGQMEQGIELIQSSLAIHPSSPVAHNNIGLALQALKRLDEALESYDKALAIEPDDADTYSNRGNVLRDLKRLDEALESYDKALAIKPDFAEAHYNRGNALQDLRRWDEALANYDRALALNPGFADAHNNRGNVLRELKRWDEALASYDNLLAIKADYAEAYSNRANALQDLKRWDEALASYDKALALKPDFAEAYSNRGNVLRELKRLDEALESYDKALAIKPGYAATYMHRGNVLRDLKRLDEALASYDKALVFKPDYAAAYSNRGTALQALKRLDEALASYDKALAIKPDFADAYYNRGNVLRDLRRPDEALASYDMGLAIKPDYAEAYCNRGNALQDLKRWDEAVTSYDKALALESDYADALNNRGNVLQDLGRHVQALEDFEKAMSVDPGHRYAFGNLAGAALRLCDWKRSARLASDLEAHVRSAKSIIAPLTVLGYSDDASLQLECARSYVWDKISFPQPPLWNGAIYHHDKIRIAYLSGDFRQHAMAYLLAELYERHDRTCFEIIGISLGEDDGSEMRARLIKAFDQFHDVGSQSDLDVAKLLYRLEVDIVVDINGHTRRARPEILSHRPCPLQVNYLGYPGTMGADFIDYIIADNTVLPTDQAAFFTEHVVHLPDCYQANDSRRAISTATPTRQEVGLPEDGFVFCCFNNNWKISAPVFDIWMRLLGSVPGSVLWLIEDSSETRKNLLAEAASRGVDYRRLIFAPRVKLEDHLARHQLADLFLDTLPYNAHTTASDALLVGLPLLTCRGSAFAGRVAASLLLAIGMPELVTESPQEYETLACKLARAPELLQSLRCKLRQNRLTHPLFDTDRFRRNIEQAYTTMWKISQQGDAPATLVTKPELSFLRSSHADA